jgi:CheY-like chemotaxis protein
MRKKSETKIYSEKLSALRVLVAEDNMINQRIVQMMLQRLGCRNPVIVSDGEEAVAAVMDAEYDVILMDVQMPRMTGIEATRLIREQTGQSGNPWIIALTAGVMQEEQNAAMEAGMNAFLPKPLSINQLEKALDSVIPSGTHLPK